MPKGIDRGGKCEANSTGRHIATRAEGFMLYRDGDPLKATCRWCDQKITRSHKKSTSWVLEEKSS